MLSSIPEQEEGNLVYFVLLQECMEVLQKDYCPEDIGYWIDKEEFWCLMEFVK